MTKQRTRTFRRAILSFATISMLVPNAPAQGQTTADDRGNTMIHPTRTGFAPVNGLQLYYEIYGSGKPLILLHGGVMASEVFGANLPELARGRQVIAVHLQGHGRTKDIDRPLSMEGMADDVAALITHLGLGKADVLGYSMGGGVALHVAIRHPELVDRLVIVSEAMKHDGWYPEVRAAFKGMAAAAPQVGASLRQSPLATTYPDVNWETLFAKIGAMASQDYDWSAGVARIQSPTMLVFADADGMLPEHMVEFWRLLGGGQRDAGQDGSGRPVARLAILPGTTHYDILNTTAVAHAVIPFLDAAPAQPQAK
jgi:pimeloyl-ACP methyl ester carboxylesterase